MKQICLYMCVAVFIVAPLSLFAAPVIRTGDSVSLKEDQSVPGDFYAFGGQITNSAAIGGDAYTMGGKITQTGAVGSDMVGAAGDFSLHAPVTDDVRVVGGTVEIADKVGGDVVVMGGELKILSTAEIEGDVLFYGGSLTIEGAVLGAVLAKAERVRIDARIGKDVDATAGTELVFGSHAVVGGNVRYKSGKDAVRAVDAVITGSLTRDSQSIVGGESPGVHSFTLVLILLFSSFVAWFVLGTGLPQLLSRTTKSFGHALLAGFAGLILLPVSVALLFASVIGILPGVVLLFAYLCLLVFSVCVSGVFLGAFISQYTTGKTSYSVWWVIVGTLTLYAATFIPAFGPVVVLAVVATVFGGILIQIYERYR